MIWMMLIEAGARLSGAHIPHLIRLATGLDWGAAALDAWLDNPIGLRSERRGYAGILFLTPPSLGRHLGYAIAPHALGADQELGHSELVLWPPRPTALGYQHIHDRIGHAIAAASSKQAVQSRLAELAAMVLPLAA